MLKLKVPLIFSAATVLFPSVKGVIEGAPVCTSKCKRCVGNWYFDMDDFCKDCPPKMDEWPCSLTAICRCDDENVLECRHATSKTAERTNSECRSWCEEIMEKGGVSVENYLKQCSIEIVELPSSEEEEQGKGVNLEKAPCFDIFIPGRTAGDKDEVDDEEHIGKRVFNVKSAHDCQEACQKDGDCERFVWKWREASDGVQPKGVCILKSRRIVQNAISIIADSVHLASSEAKKWCPPGVAKTCDSLPYKCLHCPEPRCVWQGDFYIAGPRLCNGAELCPSSEANDKTLLPPKTTPQPTLPTPTKVSRSTAEEEGLLPSAQTHADTQTGVEIEPAISTGYIPSGLTEFESTVFLSSEQHFLSSQTQVLPDPEGITIPENARTHVAGEGNHGDRPHLTRPQNLPKPKPTKTSPTNCHCDDENGGKEGSHCGGCKNVHVVVEVDS